MFVLNEIRLPLGGPAISFGCDFFVFAGKRADNERRTSFVDQDTIGFVHKHEMQAALHRLIARGIAHRAQHLAEQILIAFSLGSQQQAISQKIETHFIGRAISNVACICLATFGLWLLALDDPHGHPQRRIQWSHQFRIATSQVIVDCRQMSSLTLECGQIHRQGCRERFAFAGLHLDNGSMMNGRSAQNLHVEVSHVQLAPPRLAYKGKCFDKQLIKWFSAADAVAQT